MQYLKNYPLTWVTIILIFILCLMPVPETPVNDVPGFDKLVHTGMYGFLCLVILFERVRLVKSRPILLSHCFIGILVLPVAMSGLIELLQEYATSCRSGDWWDMGANVLGVVLVWIFFYIWVKFGKKRQIISKK